MKKRIIGIIVLAMVITAAVVLVPRLVHTCDRCDTRFVGTGYRPNALFTNEPLVLCRECAESEHAFRIALGGSVEDYRYELFDKENVK